jgi:uncharacterized membrane protein YdjX (TVP38/TMEM64 family)
MAFVPNFIVKFVIFIAQFNLKIQFFLMSVVQVLKTNKFSFSLLLILLILPLLISSTIVYLAVEYDQVIQNFIFWQWCLFYLGTCFTMALAMTPTTFIALISGYYLGWKAIPFIAVSYFFASLIGYFLAKKLDRGKFMSSIENIPGVSRIANNLKKKENSIIFFARISPVTPFAMMNVLLSYLNADLKKFLFAGFLGMLPRTLLCVYIGAQAKYIKEVLQNPNSNQWELLCFAGLLMFSVIGLFYIIMRAIKSQEVN